MDQKLTENLWIAAPSFIFGPNLNQLKLEPEISFIAGAIADLAHILFTNDPDPVTGLIDRETNLTIIEGI